MSRTSDRARRVREALKEAAESAEDEAKDLGRDIERAVRHSGDGLSDVVEEGTGVRLYPGYVRAGIWIVSAVVVIVLLAWLFG